jgi:hypothetical protein
LGTGKGNLFKYPPTSIISTFINVCQAIVLYIVRSGELYEAH